jgi:glycosyltransferase involved in cell wall biosynthesis
MKICRIIYDWPPPWSGLAPHPYELTVAQVALGHDVHVFSARWPNAGDVEKPKGVTLHSVIREPFIGTIAFTSSVLFFFKYLFWRGKNEDVDIIHSHGHFGIWIYLYRLFLQKFVPWADELKTPLVVHFHNTVKGRWEKMIKEDKFIMPHSKYVAWPLAVLADKWALQTASACIFVSKETAEEANKYYKVDVRRCFVVESGVNPARFIRIGEEERHKSRGELGFDNYDKVLLNYGMMVERKNIHVLVESLVHLPTQYKVLLVGQWGDTGYSQRVDEIRRTKGLEHRVVKVGYTPYPQIPIALQNADLMVLPSSWEGMPKVVIESLSVGIPCLVSGFKMSEEVKGVYYLDKLDPKELAEKAVKILSEHEKVDASKVIHNYSWALRAKEVEGVYDFAKKNYLA